MRADMLERFWSKVDKNGPIKIPLTSCWTWTAYKDQNGYGIFWLLGKNVRASRVSWRLAFADPGKLLVCHVCDNTSCVNPEHLFLGTNADNIKDRDDKGRTARGETSGTKLHPGTHKGTANGRAILSERAVLEIRASAAAGQTAALLAQKYLVSKSAIRHIVRKETWRF